MPSSPNSLTMTASRSRRQRQQMPHEARLAGAEKAGDDRRGDAAHRSRLLQHQRQARPRRTRPDRQAPRCPGSATRPRRGTGGRAAFPVPAPARPRWRPARPVRRRRATPRTASDFLVEPRPARIRFDSHKVRQSTSTGRSAWPLPYRVSQRSGASTVRQNGPRRARCAAMRAAISASPGSAVAQ